MIKNLNVIQDGYYDGEEFVMTGYHYPDERALFEKINEIIDYLNGGEE